MVTNRRPTAPLRAIGLHQAFGIMKILLGFGLGVLAVAALVFGYFLTGMAPVAAGAAPMPFERYLAGKALHVAIARGAPQDVPIQPTEDSLRAGADTYRQECAVCHGLPGQPKSNIAAGEFPAPPQLWQGKGVTDDPPGETFWKVQNGIRLTGMPGFGKTLSTTQMWQVSLLLANGNNLPDTVKALLSRPYSIDGPK